MDYGKIVKRAFEITKKNPYLWLFGFIIALVSGGSNFSTSYQSGGENQTLEKLGSFASTYLIAIIIVALLIFLVWLVLWVVSIMAQGGLINCAKKIEKGEETSLGDGFSVGAHYFWRLLGLSIVLGLIVFFLVLLLLMPIIAVVIVLITQSKTAGAELAVPAIFCLVLGIIFMVFVLVIFGAFLGVLSIYAMRQIVLRDGRVFASIKAAWHLIRANLKETALMFLLLLVIGAVVSMVIGIPALLIGIPALLAIISGVGLKNILLIVGGALGFLVLMLILSFLKGIYTTFHSTAWTLTFLELTESEGGESISSQAAA